MWTADVAHQQAPTAPDPRLGASCVLLGASPAPASLEGALPDHLLTEILSRLVESVGLRASVVAARRVSRLFRSCVGAALEQSLQSLCARSLDAVGLRSLVRCVLYDRSGSGSPRAAVPRFLSLKSVILTGCKGVDAQAVGLLLAHAPHVETLQLEKTMVRPEETAALAHMTRGAGVHMTLRLGCWTALHEAVSSPRRFADAFRSGALAVGGALCGIYIDACNERG